MTRALAVSVILAAALALPATGNAALPSGFVGMTSEDLLYASPAYQASNTSMQRRAGVRLLRQPFDWKSIEDPHRRFNWSVHDRFVLAAARAGISVLPVLFNPPDGLSSKPPGVVNNFTYPPRNPLDMARFVTEAVKRYGPGGALWAENPGVRARPIKSWQVWNEPSLRAYWAGAPNARQYVALLKVINDAIKAVDRRAEVVTAGIPPSVLSGAVPINKYIQQMYAAGGKSAFDTLAVNTYARSAGELKKRLRSIRKIMNSRGDRRAKIWITELGWCDRGPRHRFCVGTKKQAKLVKDSLKVIRAERKRTRVRGFVYFSWRDGRPYAPDFRDLWGLHTGLLKVDGKRKPAFRQFTRGVRALR